MNKKTGVKKVLPILLLSLFVLSALIATVKAESISAYYNSGNDGVSYFAPGYGVGTYYEKQGQTFNCTVGGYVTHADFKIYSGGNSSASDVSLIASIWTINGTYGTNAYPSVNLGYSTNVYRSMVGADNWGNFTFTTNDILLVAGTQYIFVIESYGSTFGTSGQMKWLNKATGYSGNNYQVPANTHVPSTNTGDQLFYIWVQPYYVAPTPTPSPTPSGQHYYWNGTGWSNEDTKLSAVTDQILIIVFGDVEASGIGIGIPLALVAIFAILGAKFAGSWGFLAGLTVAVILCSMYLSLGLWAVVLVGIVDAIALLRGMPSSGAKSNKGE